MEGFPEGESFNRYLLEWLESPADDSCPLGGRQAYKPALSIDPASVVTASHFRTYHTPLRDQADYIHAFDAAYRIAGDLSKRTNQKIFPYSKFYIFFEQYAHIVGTMQEILGLGLAVVLIMTSLLLGSWRAGTIVTAVVGLTILSIIGVMSVWGIR
jgi:Niemann-Pick C1 protein